MSKVGPCIYVIRNRKDGKCYVATAVNQPNRSGKSAATPVMSTDAEKGSIDPYDRRKPCPAKRKSKRSGRAKPATS